MKAHQAGAPGGAEDYVVRGLDGAFLTHTTYGLAARAKGFASDAAVWRAVNDHPGLAVVDPLVVQRRSNFNFGAPPDFQLRGFYLEDRRFAPVPVDVRDPADGQPRAAQGDRRPHGHGAARDGRDLDLAAHARRHVR